MKLTQSTLLTSYGLLISPLLTAGELFPNTTSAIASATCNSLYYQCGGINFSGASCCQGTATCHSENPYYYQCVEPTQAPSSASSSSNDTLAISVAIKEISTSSLALSSFQTTTSASAAALYGQCGGSNWNGPTVCKTGSCVSQNDYFYQCIETTVSSIDTTGSSNSAETTFSLGFSSSFEEAYTIASNDTSSSSQGYDSITSYDTPTVASATSLVISSAQDTTSTAVSSFSTTIVPSSSAVESSVDVEVSEASSVVSSTVALSSASSLASSSAASSASSSAASSASSSAASSSSSSSSFTEISGGSSGTGKTTRYWDCCKPSCSWSGKADVDSPVAACAADGTTTLGVDVQSGCTGGTAYTCTDQQPFKVSDDLAYGFAAVSLSGGSDDSMCCSCYLLTFTSTELSGKQMVVQATNTGSDLSSNQFDLAIPGGGQGIYSGCNSQWSSYSSSIWGEQYGGVSSADSCSALPSALQSGCNWRFDWFDGADNPSVDFVQIECPAALTDITGCIRND